MRLVQAENEFEIIRLLNSVFDHFPQVKYAGLYLKDEIEEDRLYMPFAYGFEIEEARSANQSAEDRHPGFVMRNKEILHIPDTQKYQGLSSSELGRKTEVKSRLWIPLLDQGQCFGSVGAASMKSMPLIKTSLIFSLNSAPFLERPFAIKCTNMY